MAESYNNWERFYHRLNMIFNGVVASSLIPFAFIFLETQKDFPDQPLLVGNVKLSVLIVSLAVSAFLIAYSQVFKKKVLIDVVHVKPLGDQLKCYLRAKLKSYALLGSVSFISLSSLFLTKDQLFSFVYVIVLFVFSLGRPTYDLVVRELMLSKEEEAKLRAGDF